MSKAKALNIGVDQAPLMILLDFAKAYNSLDRAGINQGKNGNGGQGYDNPHL